MRRWQCSLVGVVDVVIISTSVLAILLLDLLYIGLSRISFPSTKVELIRGFAKSMRDIRQLTDL